MTDGVSFEGERLHAERRAGGRRAAVTRRVVAPTIGEALDALVAGRRPDEALEGIEHRSIADGILWPDH